MTKFIAFTGAQGTGKTTMRTMLFDYFMYKEKKVLGQYIGIKKSVSRDSKALGFKINLEADYDSQNYMVHRYITEDLATRKYAEVNNYDYVILDRCVVDVIPYCLLLDSISKRNKTEIVNLAYKHFKKYPINLVYCKPLDIIVKDEDRSDDKNYQLSVDDNFIDMSLKVSTWSDIIRLANLPIKPRFAMLMEKMNQRKWI